MNDKIKELLENAEKSDAIARNKWRIENREQLRKERKEKLKELMEKDKQQTPLEWFIEQLEEKGDLRETPSIRNIQLNIDTSDYMELKQQAKEMEAIGKEMSYADGYKEGYNRAIELTKWTISNLIPPHNEQQ
jgi:hypothetical protein